MWMRGCSGQLLRPTLSKFLSCFAGVMLLGKDLGAEALRQAQESADHQCPGVKILSPLSTSGHRCRASR
ncbi:Divergent Protein Kinase Domain 1B [Manis pentadactyla]|nr:Divergent Protein Kinase Domain 1B [Manis pentadactyla]